MLRRSIGLLNAKDDFKACIVDAVQGGEVDIAIADLVAAGEQAAVFVQDRWRLDVVVSHVRDSLTIVNDSNSVGPDTHKSLRLAKKGKWKKLTRKDLHAAALI